MHSLCNQLGQERWDMLQDPSWNHYLQGGRCEEEVDSYHSILALSHQARFIRAFLSACDPCHLPFSKRFQCFFAATLASKTSTEVISITVPSVEVLSCVLCHSRWQPGFLLWWSSSSTNIGQCTWKLESWVQLNRRLGFCVLSLLEFSFVCSTSEGQFGWRSWCKGAGDLILLSPSIFLPVGAGTIGACTFA